MKGWFDAFRCDGGPTLYSFNNRTPVTGDVTIITFLVLFATLYLAFLVIFPGIRKERFATFSAVTLSLFVGAAILVSRYGSSWHIGNTTVAASYRAFSKEKIVADLGAYVGLNHVNITLRALPTTMSSMNSTNTTLAPSHVDIDFNERFQWESAGQMARQYRGALRRGLPYPVLTVAEYLAAGQEGFSWGGQYRAAGYFATIMLWMSFSAWLMMNLLVAVVPRYGAFTLTALGALLLGTNLGYLKLLPDRPLVVHLEGSALHFRLGWSFWLVLIAGTLCLIAGIAVTMAELLYPHRFSTVLEVDYDTPYDRHVIIHDSHDKRYQKKRSSSAKLEEPPSAGFGTRILRRLSSKTREDKLFPSNPQLPPNPLHSFSPIHPHHNANAPHPAHSPHSARGVDNQGFELDPPKSPWRYPFRQAQAVGLVSPATGPGVAAAQRDGRQSGVRSGSQDSGNSLASSMAGVHARARESQGIRQGSDKLREVSMW